VRYPAGHKQASRRKILDAAAELFRRRGIEATGVDSVMAAAGLTAGGFYSHFRSKEALVAAAVDTAGERAAERWFAPLADRRGVAWSRAFVARYLSEEHRDDRSAGCLVPSLAADVSRAGITPRRHFERRLRGFFEVVAEQAGATTAHERERALGAIALCVGGVLLSRVVVDRKLSGEILAACRASARQLLEGNEGRHGRGTERER
jgi:TetR/AcrR family transcriptional regulator, transcriptional repressor for nem operon